MGNAARILIGTSTNNTSDSTFESVRAVFTHCGPQAAVVWRWFWETQSRFRPTPLSSPPCHRLHVARC